MKVFYMSDIHFEFCDLDLTPLQSEETQDSILVIAGDVCPVSNNIEVMFNFFSTVAHHFREVFYVLGNHEFYGGDMKEIRNKLPHKLSIIPNLHLLDNASKLIQIEDKSVLFVGGTLWTDFNKSNPNSMLYALEMINDYRLIKVKNKHITPEQTIKEFNKTKNYIFNTAKGADQIVVITHHAPSFKSVHFKYKMQNGSLSLLNSAFYSDLDKEIERSKINVWVHGHTHDSFDYDIGNTRVVCNPKGYHDENKSFSLLKYFEI